MVRKRTEGKVLYRFCTSVAYQAANLDGWNSNPYTCEKRRRSNFFAPLELLNVETTLLMTGRGILSGRVETGLAASASSPVSCGGGVCKPFLFLDAWTRVWCPACSSGRFAIVFLSKGRRVWDKYFFLKKYYKL